MKRILSFAIILTLLISVALPAMAIQLVDPAWKPLEMDGSGLGYNTIWLADGVWGYDGDPSFTVGALRAANYLLFAFDSRPSAGVNFAWGLNVDIILTAEPGDLIESGGKFIMAVRVNEDNMPGVGSATDVAVGIQRQEADIGIKVLAYLSDSTSVPGTGGGGGGNGGGNGGGGGGGGSNNAGKTNDSTMIALAITLLLASVIGFFVIRRRVSA
jgi:uncharacterized membrane protein YgcG